MKAILLTLLMLALCAALFFAAPYRARLEFDSIASTLSQCYANMFSDMSSSHPERFMLFSLVSALGILAAFYPAVWVACISWRPLESGRTGSWGYVAGGICATLGAIANYGIMLFSNMNFMTGAGRVRKETPYFWGIVTFQAAFGLASFAHAFSVTVAQLLSRALAL